MKTSIKLLREEDYRIKKGEDDPTWEVRYIADP